MSEFIGVIQGIVQDTIEAMKLTDKATGTVVSLSPLTVQTDANMPPIPASALLLTESVKALKAGDRLLMLRVQNGQQYIVLSRIT